MARKTLIQLRRDTAANWTSANPTLAAGEGGWESDTNKLKIGDGSTAWNSLAYFAGVNAVSSVFGRTGAVVAATNDYTEAQLSFSDITTNNASTSKHGLLKKLDNSAAHFMDGQGNWSTPAGTAPGVAADPIWDAKGDLAVGTGADTASKLSVGSDGQILAADSTQATGQKWVTPSKIYLNKPADGITRASTSIGAFSTAWQITGVVVAAGQNVKLEVDVAVTRPAGGGDCLLAIFRDSTQIEGKVWSSQGNIATNFRWTWIDQNPGAATYTYEIRAAQFTSGTLTVKQTNVTTDAAGGSSIFIAEVYTP